MLFFMSNVPPETLIPLAIGWILGGLIGMTIHEFAHNYVAFLMGDPTPANQGRLNLNPMTHIYWPGFIMFVLIGFGILGSAPISAQRMRNPRWGYLAAVAAGPFSNLLLAVVIAIIVRLLGFPDAAFSSEFMLNVYFVLLMLVQFNVLLFVFNLLPLFPLDGWWIVLSLLPSDLAYTWERNAQTTQYIFLGLILLSFVPIGNFDPLGLIIVQPISFIMGILGF